MGGADIPLGEASEAYQVGIYSDSAYENLIRTLEATDETVTYTFDQQSEDFGGSSTMYVQVQQISDTYGPGHYLRGTVGIVDPRTLFLFHGDGADESTDIVDSSIYARSVSVVGNAQIDTAVAGTYGTGRILFDGSGDAVVMADSTDFTFGSGDFFVAARVRFASVPASTMYIMGQISAAATNATLSILIDKTAANKIHAFCCSGASVIGEITGTTTVTTGVDYQISYERSGSNFRLCIEGVSEGTASSALAINDSAASWALGRAGDYVGGGFLNGWIEEAILQNYAPHSAGTFTPPSGPY
jgi:hypothetical protein